MQQHLDYLLDGLDLGGLVISDHALRGADLEEWKIRLFGNVGRNCCLSASWRTCQQMYQFSAMRSHLLSSNAQIP